MKEKTSENLMLTRTCVCTQAHARKTTLTPVINKGKKLNWRLKERAWIQQSCIKSLEKGNQAAIGISTLSLYGAQRWFYSQCSFTAHLVSRNSQWHVLVCVLWISTRGQWWIQQGVFLSVGYTQEIKCCPKSKGKILVPQKSMVESQLPGTYSPGYCLIQPIVCVLRNKESTCIWNHFRSVFDSVSVGSWIPGVKTCGPIFSKENRLENWECQSHPPKHDLQLVPLKKLVPAKNLTQWSQTANPTRTRCCCALARWRGPGHRVPMPEHTC